MKYKKLAAFLLAACMLMNLVACNKEKEELPPEEPVDPNWPLQLVVNGENITLEEAPDSFVSLSPSITSLFYDLEEESVLDGVSSYAPSQAASKTDCGTAQDVDLDAVKEIAPDFLLTDTPLLTEQLTELQQMNVKVLEISRPQSLEEITMRAQLIVKMLYGKTDGQAKADELEELYEDLWQPLEDSGKAVAVDEKKTALLLADLDLAATGDSWEAQLLELMGLKNLAQEGDYWQLPEVQTAEDGSKAYLYGDVPVEWDPAVIFYRSDMDVEAIKASDWYMNSTAVAENALYPLDWDALQMQSMELPETLGDAVAEIYPDVWKQIQDAIAEKKAAEQAAAEAAAQAQAEQSTTTEE